MFKNGDVIPYLQMCSEEGLSLQRGMNYHVKGLKNIILMSLRPNAPYADRVEDDGRILIYEGHDAPRHKGGPDPKSINQPQFTPAGKPTQNGHFFSAAKAFKESGKAPEVVRVYEKIKDGIWVFNGEFWLVDAWIEQSGKRNVFKFKLVAIDDSEKGPTPDHASFLTHARIIPASVKQTVWIRDKGRCIECGSTDNLHYDHIIPFSKGGSSLVAENVQLLCARHNLSKGARIQ